VERGGRVFPRVLITAGEYECIVDSIQRTGAVIAEEVKDGVRLA
jgi:hypothetical protein